MKRKDKPGPKPHGWAMRSVRARVEDIERLERLAARMRKRLPPGGEVTVSSLLREAITRGLDVLERQEDRAPAR